MATKKYTAKTSNWNWYEGVVKEPEEEGGEKVQETVIHSWTKGNEYEITIDKEENTVQFESDNGTSGVIPALSCNKDLLSAVFDIDISDIIQSSIDRQKASLRNDYNALNLNS